MLEVLRKRCKAVKRLLLEILACVFIIGCCLSASEFAVFQLLKQPVKLQETTDYKSLKGEYVTFDVKYVIDQFAEETNDKGETTRQYYMVYSEEDNIIFGISVSPKMDEEMTDKIDKTWEWLDGTTNDVEGSITIKGTLEKMPYQIGTYFESTYNDMFEEGFDEMAQLYFINSGNIIANGDVTVTGACIWTIVAACVLIYMIYIIVYTMIGKHDKHIRKYLQKNPSVSMAQLDADFEKAQQISKDIYVGKHWTFYIQGRNIKILDNTKLVWAYHYVRTGKHSVSELVTYDVSRQYVSIPSSRKDGEKILENFSHNQPQIIAGYDKEIENMYYKDFNTLLDYRYNKYSQKDDNLMIENQ